MRDYLNKLLFIIGDKRKKLPFLIAIFCALSFLDILGIGLLLPVIATITGASIELPGLNSNFALTSLNNIQIIMFLCFVALIFIMKGVIGFSVQKKILSFGYNIQEILIQQLLSIYQKMPYEEIGSRNSSTIIQTVVSNLELFNYGTLIAMMRLIAELIACIVIVSFLCIINIWVTITIIILSAMTFLLYDKIFRVKITMTGKMAAEGREGVIKGLKESIAGYKVIRSLGLYNHFLNQVKSDTIIMKDNTVLYKSLAVIPRYLIETTAVLFLMIFLGIAIFLGSDLASTLATFTLFTIAIVRLMPSFNAIVGSISSIRNSKYTVDELYSDIKRFSPSNYSDDSFYADIIPDLSKQSLKEFEEIVIKNAYFKYQGTEDYIIDNLSLKIKKGEAIGIIGGSGAGKTTLVDLIVGMHTLSKGQILLDDSPINDDLRTWLSRICYLPQNTFLIDDSIENNICLAIHPNLINKTKLNEVLKATQLDDFVDSLPDGIHTNVGEEGIKISGGQKQRIAMARALYYDRTIIIMDEGTSSLDKNTENAILEQINLFKGERTFIVIAHNLSTLKYCDYIYEIHHGKIVNKSTFKELSESSTY